MSSSNTQATSQAAGSSSNNQSSSIRCTVCRRSFDTQAGYDDHVAVHAPGFSQPNNGRICTACNFEHSSKCALYRNIFSEAENKMVYGGMMTCSYCGDTFSDKIQVNHHKAGVHGVRYTCEHCGRVFNDYDRYDEHMSWQGKSTGCIGHNAAGQPSQDD